MTQSELRLSQLDMVLEQVFGSDPCARNIGKIAKISGQIDVERLIQSHEQVVADIEALRIGFKVAGGVYYQILHQHKIESIRFLDWSGMGAGDDQVRTMVDAELGRPYDIFHDVLHQAILVQTAPQTFYYCALVHHACLDNRGMDVWLERLSAVYAQSQPAAAVSYTGWMAGRYAAYDQPHYERSRAYWKAAQKGEPAYLLQPQPAGGAYSRKKRMFDLSPELDTALKNYQAIKNTGASSVMIAVLYLLFARFYSTRRVLIGSACHNRVSPVEKHIAGNLVSVIPLSLEFGSTTSFDTLAGQVYQLIHSSYPHAVFSTGEMVRSGVARHTGSRGLYEIAYNQVPLTRAFSFAGMPAQTSICGNMFGSTPFVLKFSEGIETCLCIEYSTEYFEEKQVNTLGLLFKHLLGQALAAPETQIGDFQLVSAEERHTRLQVWNPPLLNPTGLANVARRVAQQARAEAVALVFKQQRVSYAELNHRIGCFAAFLAANGVSRGQQVGIYGERSIEMIVSMLALLHLGAVYIPLDPHYPLERTRYVLEDSDLRLILAPPDKHGEIRNIYPHALLSWNCGNGDTEPYPAAVTPAAGELAYIIYTSGSTGKPKGVQVTHLGLSNFLTSMQRMPGFQPEDRLLSVTTFSFDIAALEFFLPLVSGGQLVLLETAAARDAVSIRQALEEHDITVLQATPATWQMLLTSGWSGKANLKMLCGGESWPPHLLPALQGKVQSLWNMYGPTETTVWSAAAEMTGDEVLISHPVDNTQIYLLDPFLALVPQGMIAEICIAGAGLALGYLNQPELTAGRFVRNPYAPDLSSRTGDLGCDRSDSGQIGSHPSTPGLLCRTGDLGCDRDDSGQVGSNPSTPGLLCRTADLGCDRDDGGQIGSHPSTPGLLYRTGDLGRYCNDSGQIEFIGRMDDQIKLRGYRIEIGEIEQVLAQHPDVQRAVVFLAGGDIEQKHLVAYWQPAGAAGSNEALQQHLAASLADYMLPSLIIKAEQLPLTSNGKVDRKRVAEIHSHAKKPYEAARPNTETEQILLQIWQEVLGEQNMGTEDNFFHLGGTSLLATKMILRVEKQLNRHIEVINIFKYFTIRKFAGFLQGHAETVGYDPGSAAARMELKRQAQMAVRNKHRTTVSQ